MQKGYVHAVMKLPRSKINSGRRMAIVFRNGKETHVGHDSGYLQLNIHAPERVINYTFGSMSDMIIEGKLYSREYLYRSGAHLNERGGVSGNMSDGCPSIVVTKVSHDLDEFDAFLYMSYYAEPRQRSGALHKSYDKKLPIRVFRSSNGKEGKFHPSSKFPQHVCYRFDGVYYIISVKQRYENHALQERETRKRPGFVFYLVRSEPQSEMLQLKTHYPIFQPFSSDDERCFNVLKSSDICNFQFDPLHYKSWLHEPLQHLGTKLN
jgi:SAD/SRA domain